MDDPPYSKIQTREKLPTKVTAQKLCQENNDVSPNLNFLTLPNLNFLGVRPLRAIAGVSATALKKNLPLFIAVLKGGLRGKAERREKAASALVREYCANVVHLCRKNDIGAWRLLCRYRHRLGTRS